MKLFFRQILFGPSQVSITYVAIAKTSELDIMEMFKNILTFQLFSTGFSIVFVHFGNNY